MCTYTVSNGMQMSLCHSGDGIHISWVRIPCRNLCVSPVLVSSGTDKLCLCRLWFFHMLIITTKYYNSSNNVSGFIHVLGTMQSKMAAPRGKDGRVVTWLKGCGTSPNTTGDFVGFMWVGWSNHLMQSVSFPHGETKANITELMCHVFGEQQYQMTHSIQPLYHVYLYK